MTNPDFRALCAELLEWADKSSAHYYVKPDLFTRVRDALVQPAPEPPGSDEIAATIPWLLEMAAEEADAGNSWKASKLTLAAQLLGER